MFAKNFFAAGGIAAIDKMVSIRPGRRRRVQNSGAKLACICASDAVYAEKALPLPGRLRMQARRQFTWRGPREEEAELHQAGVTDFIYAGCDVLRVLQARNAGSSREEICEFCWE